MRGVGKQALHDKMARLDEVALACEVEIDLHLAGYLPCGDAGCTQAFTHLREQVYDAAMKLCLVHKIPLTPFFLLLYDRKMKNA